MFDNLREMSDGSPIAEESDELFYEVEPMAVPEVRVFGMTTGQRFLISVLMLATVIVLGVTFLMVFERIWF